MFIENRIKKVRVRNEQIRGQRLKLIEISKNQGLSNLGKLQFHRKVEKEFRKQKDKTFSQKN